MKLVRYNEHPLLSHFNDLDRWFSNPAEGLGNFGRFFELADRLAGANRYRLAADLYEDDHNFYARVELPGAKKEDVNVELNNGSLTISYNRKTEGDDRQESVDLRRSLAVPDSIKADDISAKLEDGVLTVTLPKAEERKPRQISVN